MIGMRRASCRFYSCNTCLRMCYPSISNVSRRKKRLDWWWKRLRNGCSSGMSMNLIFLRCNFAAQMLRLQRRLQKIRWLQQRDSLKLKLITVLEWMLPQMPRKKQDKTVNKHSMTEEQEPSKTTASIKMDQELLSLQETHPTSRT